MEKQMDIKVGVLYDGAWYGVIQVNNIDRLTTRRHATEPDAAADLWELVRLLGWAAE